MQFTLAPNQLAFAGDSLMMGFNSTSTNGTRRDVSFIVNNDGLLIDFVGSLGPTGSSSPAWDRDHCCQNGASSATITSNVLADLASGVMSHVRLLIIDMGINDVANTGTAGIPAAAAVYANLKTIMAALKAKHSDAQIVFQNLMPVQPATTGAAEIVPFNNEWSKVGGYRDVWNATDFPNNKIEIFDAFTAIGGVWDNTLMNGDRLHPAQAGYDLLNPAMVTLLRTSSIVTLRGIRNNLNALACPFTAPAPATTVFVGVPVSVTGVVSRAKQNVTVTIKKGVTTLGVATVDQYTGVWTYSWTPVLGDVGAITLNASVVDTLNGDTATTTGVDVTVQNSASFSDLTTIISSVPILRDWWADANVSEAGGAGTGVSNWVDQVNAGSAAQATASLRVAYTAADATLNNKGSLRGDATDNYLQDAALNLPAPGTTNIWIWIIFKQRTWASGRYFFGCSATAYRLEQIAGVTPQLFAGMSSISSANGAGTLNSWFRGEMLFTNSTSDYLKIGATTVTGVNLGNTDPAAGFFLFARNVAGFIDGDIARIVICQGKPTAGEITALDAAMSTYYNNIPGV